MASFSSFSKWCVYCCDYVINLFSSYLAQITTLAKLKHLFALGNREAEDITLDVTMKVYRKRLAQAAVAGGELDQASSKAAYLQNLCDNIHFDTEKAKEIHEG